MLIAVVAAIVCLWALVVVLSKHRPTSNWGVTYMFKNAKKEVIDLFSRLKRGFKQGEE